MAQSATQRRAAQRRLAKNVKSGNMGKTAIGKASAKAAAKLKQAAGFTGSSSGHTATHALGQQFGNNSGSTTLVGGPSRGKHAGSYNHAKDVSSVARTGDTAMGRHARGGPMSMGK